MTRFIRSLLRSKITQEGKTVRVEAHSLEDLKRICEVLPNPQGLISYYPENGEYKYSYKTTTA